jgi:hypothetical protein
MTRDSPQFCKAQQGNLRGLAAERRIDWTPAGHYQSFAKGSCGVILGVTGR